MWVRSTLAYRASFALTLLSGVLLTGLDFVSILLMFSQVSTLGGWSLREIALLYGLSVTAFGIADLLLGSVSRVGTRLRDGSFDVLLVRPVPVLAQVAADRFALRRLARISQGGLVLGYGLGAVAWTLPNALLIAVTLLSGALIFSSVLVAGGAFQFVAQDAAEVESAFTYGGQTMLQFPPTVFGKELVRGVTFVFPIAFVNWVPVAHVLGRPYPVALPEGAAWAPPLVAGVCCAAAGAVWRVGLKSYRSTGS